MKTEVILTSNIIGLGGESDHVKVAAGYARNYLFPQRLAIPLTQANKRQIEALQKRRAEREAHEFNTMSELARSLSSLTCIVTVKTGEDGKMFGTVTAGMIAEQLKNQLDVTLDKRKIHFEQPIKALGEHEVELHLHHEVKGILKVRVESSTPITAPVEPAAPAADTKAGDQRTEKRSRRFEGDRPERARKPAKSDQSAAPRPRAERSSGKGARGGKPAKADSTA